MAIANDHGELRHHFSVSSLLHPVGDGLSIVKDSVRLPTGMDPLDRMLGGGFRPSDLVVLGGRPGVGKTIVGLQWARAMALSGASVYVASYEHDEQTMLGRLVALEIGMLELGPVDAETEALVSGILNGEFSVATEVGRNPLVRAALSRIDGYAERLMLVPAARLRLDLDQLEKSYTEIKAERKALLIDYVQKVPVPGVGSSWEAEGARVVAERLKELALATMSVVFAVAAVDEQGLQARRVRLPHLRSAASISYEADVAVIMNDKAMCTSRVHLAYDLTRLEEYERTVVFSIEKNRTGRAQLELEFEKDFGRFRFLPDGGFVAETLIDGVLVET